MNMSRFQKWAPHCHHHHHHHGRRLCRMAPTVALLLPPQ